MVKILIVNNGTAYLKEIKNSLNSFEYSIIDFKDLDFKKTKEFTHIILSGSKEKIDFNKFKEQIRIINKLNKPILGICFGCQLISKNFKADIEKMPAYRKGKLKIKIIKKDKIFKNLKNKIEIYHDHGYNTKNIKKNLIVLAESEDGNEVIKHKTKKIYGFQFHPEKSKDGLKLIKNFINLFS